MRKWSDRYLNSVCGESFHFLYFNIDFESGITVSSANLNALSPAEYWHRYRLYQLDTKRTIPDQPRLAMPLPSRCATITD